MKRRYHIKSWDRVGDALLVWVTGGGVAFVVVNQRGVKPFIPKS